MQISHTTRCDSATRRAPALDRSADAGTTLVEILVAIVLLGTAVVAMLGALRASVTGSALNRDHANAHAWLQTASDVLYGSTLEDCGTETSPRTSEMIAAYQAIVQGTENPEGWPASNIRVASVEFWNGEDAYQGTCYDDSGINLQLITLEVRNLDGRIVESVQVVKG